MLHAFAVRETGDTAAAAHLVLQPCLLRYQKLVVKDCTLPKPTGRIHEGTMGSYGRGVEAHEVASSLPPPS
jgi:hypothetical protein